MQQSMMLVLLLGANIAAVGDCVIKENKGVFIGDRGWSNAGNVVVTGGCMIFLPS